MDQAHHFATLSSASGSGHKTNDVAQLFREGLDVTERESMYNITPFVRLSKPAVAVFALAQASAKKTKRWYEEGDLNRH